MTDTRGVDPKTRQQRQGRPGHWSAPAPMGDKVEYRDAPMRTVAEALLFAAGGLLVVVFAVVLLIRAVQGPRPLLPQTAEARFRTAGPPLLAAPRDERIALETAHRGPNEAAIDRAMDQVVREGWGPSTPPPDRGEVAMNRARPRP